MRIAWRSDPEEVPFYNQRPARRVRALGHDVAVLHRIAESRAQGRYFSIS